MSLVSLMQNLDTRQLLELHTALVDASIANSLNRDFKPIFKKSRATSKGKLKKLYSALSKAKKEDIARMSDELIGLLPRGIQEWV